MESPAFFHHSPTQQKREYEHFNINQNPFITNTSPTRRPHLNFEKIPIVDYSNTLSTQNSNFKNFNSNNMNLSSNSFVMNKSISFMQQNKYDQIKKYCMKKQDCLSYPLISYENFLQLENILENQNLNQSYTNFLLNGKISIEFYNKFITLLMNRYVLQQIKLYPRVTFQLIFDIENIKNYLSEDTINIANNSNMLIILVKTNNNAENWNVICIVPNKEICNFYLLDNNLFDKNIIGNIMINICKIVYGEKKFNFNVNDLTGISNRTKDIMSLIIIEFLSRNRIDFPFDDEDIYYQTILIFSEILNNNLITK